VRPPPQPGQLRQLKRGSHEREYQYSSPQRGDRRVQAERRPQEQARCVDAADQMGRCASYPEPLLQARGEIQEYIHPPRAQRRRKPSGQRARSYTACTDGYSRLASWNPIASGTRLPAKAFNLALGRGLTGRCGLGWVPASGSASRCAVRNAPA
jgi:hypothetical protein